MKFVPASGVASRMFKTLLSASASKRPLRREELAQVAAAGNHDARETLEVLEALPRFAFFKELQTALAASGRRIDHDLREGRFDAIVACLVGPKGLNYAGLPKGLLPFHQYDGAGRTAFEEHLVEAAGYAKDAQGRCRLHFTISPEHQEAIASAIAEKQQEYERRFSCRFEVRYSIQKPSTDTLAVDAAGAPARQVDGRLLLRPGGHGALIENLAESGGDIVFIKNIDNVAPDRMQGETIRWKLALAGLLVGLQAECQRHLQRLGASSADEQAIDAVVGFITSRLGRTMEQAGACTSLQARRAAAVSALNRPLRVCGVVRNAGEPGGGPFWVKGPQGEASKQIVEAAQVEASAQDQKRLFADSTHFNPVDLVCSVRDAQGAPFTLSEYVDEEAVFIARKSQDGRELTVLERPGLWNGAMAYWNTVFVEVPLATFNPVKTLLDLLRPAHQA